MKKKSLLHNVRLVLARPKYSGNLGAIARAAANFDVRDLWVVAPRRPFNRLEAGQFAMGPAQDYLNSLQFVATLKEALQDIPVVIGLTRREGQIRAPDIDLGEILTKLKERPVALVFGSEEGGLNKAEVEACHFIYRIPTSNIMPALNLSHAVAVMLARIYEELDKGKAKGQAVKKSCPNSRQQKFASADEVSSMLEHWRTFLLQIGLNSAGNPDRVLVKLKKIFAKSSLTHSESNTWRGILSRAQKTLKIK